jgi:hypothetical protein
MKEMAFINPKRNSTFHIKEIENVEYSNPINFWSDCFMTIDISLMKSIMEMEEPSFNTTEEIKQRVYKRVALKNWQKEYQKIMETPTNENLILLLQTTKRSKQEKLLKELCLDSDDLIPLFFLAWNDYGYSFSNYTIKHFKGVSANEMPKMAYIEENGELTVIGETLLKPEQIKKAIKDQHRLVARFLDNGETWHCFFQTMKGINGNEKGCKSHIHYISSAFNISREDVLNQLKSEKYKLPRLPHIDFKRID